MRRQISILLAALLVLTLLVGCGGQERERTRKAEMKDAFYSVWGFKVYNRGLGALFAPYRKYRFKKLAHLGHLHTK